MEKILISCSAERYNDIVHSLSISEDCPFSGQSCPGQDCESCVRTYLVRVSNGYEIYGRPPVKEESTLDLRTYLYSLLSKVSIEIIILLDQHKEIPVTLTNEYNKIWNTIKVWEES